MRLPRLSRRRKLPVATPSASSSASDVGGPPPFLVRFQKQYRGLRRRRQGWDSPVAGGLDGFAWRTEIDAYRDAARGVPEASWGAVLPRAVTATREVAEGEMAAIGAAWQRERHKYDIPVARRAPRLAMSERSLQLATDDVNQVEGEFFGLETDTETGEKAPANDPRGAKKGYLGFLDAELREEHFSRGVTKDDYLRLYDTRFSAQSVGYWTIIFVLTVAEFPLNEKVFTQLGDQKLAYIVAAGLGVALISAAHFVGVTFRRFADIREARLFEQLDAEKQLDETPDDPVAKNRLARFANDLPRHRRGFFGTIRDYIRGRTIDDDHLASERLRQREQHVRAAGGIAAFITALVIISALFLGYARAGLVQNEQNGTIQTAAVNARLLCDTASDAATRNCAAEARQAAAQAQASQISQPRALSTIQYGALQILIFFVAAALTFYHHNEVVNAIRQGRARISYLRRRRWLADRINARRRARMNRAVARRWARYDFRYDQAEAVARYYRSVIDNYYEVNLQARSDAEEHGAEISAQPRPVFRYPGWMFEDLTIPERGLSDSQLPTKTRQPGFRVVSAADRSQDEGISGDCGGPRVRSSK